MKKNVLVALTLLYSTLSFSQSLTVNEFADLANKLQSFLLKKDNLYDAKRTTQFIYILASIDSIGTVRKIGLSGVKTDTLYRILAGLKPGDLDQWRCMSCKDKTIVIPLFYRSANNTKDDKVDQMLVYHYAKIPHKDMITEVGNTIFIRWLYFSSPQNQNEENLPEKEIRIDTLKTKNK